MDSFPSGNQKDWQASFLFLTAARISNMHKRSRTVITVLLLLCNLFSRIFPNAPLQIAISIVQKLPFAEILIIIFYQYFFCF